MCIANSLISYVQVWQLFCMNAGWAAWKTTSHSRLLNILRLWSWCLVCLRPLCMQVLFPNGFVHLFQNPGESSADPGMDSSNLVRFSSRKVQLYFCRVLCVFEQDLLHFSSKIIRRHCGRSKFHTKLKLAKGTIFKILYWKRILPVEFKYSPILCCCFFICLRLFQCPVLTPGWSSLPKLYLKPLKF